MNVKVSLILKVNDGMRVCVSGGGGVRVYRNVMVRVSGVRGRVSGAVKERMNGDAKALLKSPYSSPFVMERESEQLKVSKKVGERVNGWLRVENHGHGDNDVY